MFCGNCGAENADGAKFCKGCGKPLDSSVGNTKEEASPVDSANNGTNASPKVDVSNIADKMKALPKKTIGIVSAAVVALIVVIAIASNSAKTINLNDYLTVEAEGYDGRGRAKTTIDWDAIEQKYGTKVSFTSAAKSEYGGLLNMMTPIEGIQESVSLKLSESSELSNGDIIEYTWDIDDDLTKYVKCKVKFKDGSYTVSGLEEIGSFDPFVGVDVSFTGIAPNGRANLEKTPNDNGLYYDIENGYNVSNGDKVTVTVSYGWGSEESYVEERGQLPSSMSKEYTVEGLDEYVTTFADIDETLISEMKSQSEDTISSYVAKSYDKTSSLGTLEYVGYVFCGSKSGVDYWSTYNTLYVIYRGNAANTDGKFDAVDVYFPVQFSNFLKNGEGIHYEQCDGIKGSSNFSNSWYSTKGYTNPLLAYIDIAEANKADYNVECGDGFESYSEYSLISSLGDIDSTYLSELEEKATETVLSYIAKDYSDESHVDGLEVKGEYLLVAKNQGTDFAKNNTLVVVLGGYLHNDRDKFDACDVFYPVEFDGIVSLPDKWMYTKSDGLIGYSNIGDSWYSTKGYTDGTKMYSDIVTSNRDNYTYEVSEGLKEFGE